MTQPPEYRRLVRLAAGYNRKAANLGLRGRVNADDLWHLSHTTTQCAYCFVALAPGHGSFDHVIPFGRGGTNDMGNIARCCMRCQRAKHVKTASEYNPDRELSVSCAVCGRIFHPRWSEYQRGDARTCSRSCAGRRRWLSTSERSMPAVDALVGRLKAGKRQ